MLVAIGAFLGAALGAFGATLVVGFFATASLPVRIASAVASGALDAFEGRGKESDSEKTDSNLGD